jgi:putative acetyltransferase
VIIREEVLDDAPFIRAVHDGAFGRSSEGRLVDRLRDDGLMATSTVALAGNRIVGSAVFSRLVLETSAGVIRSVALAPVAVVPEFQRAGFGTALIREGIRLCKVRGECATFVLGDPGYYERFGFSQKLAERIDSIYSGPHWMALELTDGALANPGRVTYPSAFEEV